MATVLSRRPPLRPATRLDFEIAIICALSLEANAISKLFDSPSPWDTIGPPYDKAPGDPNAYSTGAIGRHNVVLVHMPRMGKSEAAAAAASCRSSFPNIKLAVLVGICAAVPFPDAKLASGTTEIILGDVIISTGAVQYDFGRETTRGFVAKDTVLDNLAKPNSEISSVLAKLRMDDVMARLQTEMTVHMGGLGVRYPGPAGDTVFAAEHEHKGGDDSCKGCGVPRQRKRLSLSLSGGRAGSATAAVPELKVHLGMVATGDTVMKSGKSRDKIAKDKGVIAFEMEAAGVWDRFPCVVIKGACDYGDSHKSKGWQDFAAARAAACMKAFLGHWVPSRPEPPPLYEPPVEPQFLVPYPKNEGFVGRTDILRKLKELLHPGKHTIVTLVGVGGIGKTQIALQYAHSCWEEHKGVSVFWVHAGSTEQFQQSYASVARQFRVPGYVDPKEDVRPLVRDWLERDTKRQWLMVLDNADNSALFSGEARDQSLERFIPRCAHVSVLATTRHTAGLGLLGEKPPIPVQRMEYIYVNRLISSATKVNPTGAKEMTALFTQLEGLPLAVAQAAAFIRDQQITVAEYLGLLKKSEKRLEALLGDHVVGKTSGTLQAAVRTWFLSFEKAQKQSRAAGDILSLMSCLDSQAVPPTFLARYTKRQEEVKENAPQRADPVTVLKSLALVSQDADGGLEMVRPVRSLVRKWLLKREKTSHFENQALMVVSRAYPSGNADNRATCSGYHGHVAAVLRFQEEALSKDAKLLKATLLCNTAGFSGLQGLWKDAEGLFHRALALREKGLGASHPLTLKGRCGLAVVYRKQGRLARAWELEKSVMDTRASTAGSDPFLILANKANLASILGAQGEWERAEKMEAEVMEGRKAASGLEHTSTLASMSSLAATFRKRGKWVEAEKLETYVMKTRVRVWGERDALMLTSMSNLSATYRKQGRWEDAESLELRVVETSRVVFGDEHLPTLTSMANLASIFGSRGRWRDAISLETKVKEMRARVLGEVHPLTLATASGLAATFWKAGRFEEGTRLEEQVLRTRTEARGAGDPLTLTTKSNLASMYRKLGLWGKAVSLERQVMATFEREFQAKLGYRVMRDGMDMLASAQSVNVQDAQQQTMDPIRQFVKLWQQVLVGNQVWEKQEKEEREMEGYYGGSIQEFSLTTPGVEQPPPPYFSAPATVPV